MSGDTQSRHCWWLMLVVSLEHIADTGSGYVGHTRTVMSSPPETMREPSGLNATLSTVPVWPVSGSPIGFPVSASHTRIASGGDNTGRLWPTYADPASAMCAKLTTNMSHQQWRDWVSPNIDYIKLCLNLPIAPD